MKTQAVQIMKRTSSTRILAIDDEPIILEIVQGCLEDLAGWDVLIAKSGEEGLRKAIEEKPDAIVLDMMMPEMDGLGFLRRLRSDSKTQSIPVILLTVDEEFTDRRWRSVLNLAAVLTKPFDPYQLIKQISTAINRNEEN